MSSKVDRVAVDGLIHQCLTMALQVARDVFPERNIVPPMTDWKRTGDASVQVGHLHVLRDVLKEITAGPLVGKKRSEIL